MNLFTTDNEVDFQLKKIYSLVRAKNSNAQIAVELNEMGMLHLETNQGWTEAQVEQAAASFGLRKKNPRFLQSKNNLTKCVACEHEVSNEASKCPSCGHPLKSGYGGCLIVFAVCALLLLFLI